MMTTADRVEIVATVVGGTAGVTPTYFGDYVALAGSTIIFIVKPSWSNAANVGGDFVGAILPGVGAIGTARKAKDLAQGVNDLKKVEKVVEGVNDIKLARGVKEFTKAMYTGIEKSEGKILNQTAKAVEQILKEKGVWHKNLAVGVSVGVVDDDLRYVISVSDPKAWEVLKKAGFEVTENAPVAPLEPWKHVEFEGGVHLRKQGAKGILTGTNFQACVGCESQWVEGKMGDVWHTNRRR